jgi:NAD+ diphosphatase
MFRPNLAAVDRLNRHSDKRGDETFIAEQINAPSSQFIVLVDDKPVIISAGPGEVGSVRWFTLTDLKEYGFPVEQSYFLGTHPSNGGGWFALAVTEHLAKTAPNPVQTMRPAVDLRSLAMQGALPSEEISTIGMAKALHHWHDNARHCGHCGGTTEIKDGGWRRSCWSCGRQHFPRTDPVVIMLIVDPEGERCLLGHEARFAPNMWSTLAGFIEHGEDVEHAVRRETMEEAGIKIGEVRYHSTQPWPFPHSLMIGCHGIAETTEITIDPKEIQDARWFTRNEILLMLDESHPEDLWVPGKQAIARSLIQSFADGEVA